MQASYEFHAILKIRFISAARSEFLHLVFLMMLVLVQTAASAWMPVLVLLPGLGLR